MVHGGLEQWVNKMSCLAKKNGLDPLPTEFYLVKDEEIYTLSSYYVPGRYRHWTHGERYWIAKQRDEQGMGRIYELVINSDPSLAYLLDKNPDAYNVLVVGHVLAHTDFFQRNRLLSQVRRDNVGLWFRQHAEWLEELHQQYSFERVEKLIDAAHTLSQLVDFHYRSPQWVPSSGRRATPAARKKFDWVQGLYEEAAPVDDISAPPPMSHWKIAPYTQDVLGLIIDVGRLDNDERAALTMLREEMLYFKPQALTKYMNEGWATFWHVRLIRQFDGWDESDSIEAFRLHALVTQNQQFLNPYYFGWTLWELLNDTIGLEKCFELVAEDTDLQWVNQWVTEDLVREAQNRHLWPEWRPVDINDPSAGMEPYPSKELADDIQRVFFPDVPEIFVDQIDATNHRLDLVYHGERSLHSEYTQDVVNAIAFLWGGDVILTSPHKIWYGNEADWRRRA
ncbi:MAG: SpoVR family protein [Firmicutes bacterium]|nr:SpoVR family protein [Bacillota bacterium]